MEKLALSECIHSTVDSWKNGNLFIHFHVFINNTWVSVTSPSSFFLSFFFFFGHVAWGILVPRPGIEPQPLVVKVWSPNHWTIREFPHYLSWWHQWPSSQSLNICTVCPRGISNVSGPKLNTLLYSPNLLWLLCPYLYYHPTNYEWRNLMVICDFFLSLHSPHPLNHQILLTPPPKSVQGPVPALHPPCPWLTSDQNHLPGIFSQLPEESSCISSLQSSYWYPDLIWSYPITAQSLEHSPLSKLTVSLEVRSLLKVYLDFFLATQSNMWDLSFLTRDQTLTPCRQSRVLTTGSPGKDHTAETNFTKSEFLQIPTKFLPRSLSA